jgi:hypothetical protein
MALALVATVGAATANSYATLVNADSYFEAHPDYTTWDALATPAKERYLILATTLIDMEPIDGAKYDTTTTSGVPDQALRFPRVVDYIDATKVIPRAVTVAMYEQAIEMARTGTSSTRQTLQSEGVVEIQIGQAREKYAEGGGVSNTQLSSRPRRILMSAGLLKVGGSWA